MAALKFFDHQVAPNRVGIDRTIQVTSTVEIVGQAERIPVPQIALNAHIRLLRVGVNEIRRLRISERLESKRQESRLRGIAGSS